MHIKYLFINKEQSICNFRQSRFLENVTRCSLNQPINQAYQEKFNTSFKKCPEYDFIIHK